MHRAIKYAVTLLGVVLATPSLSAAQSEKRVALVIGNAAYQQGALPTAANDAGLIAQTLQAAGFDVVGARDLDGDTLRHTFRDFIEKMAAAGYVKLKQVDRSLLVELKEQHQVEGPEVEAEVPASAATAAVGSQGSSSRYWSPDAGALRTSVLRRGTLSTSVAVLLLSGRVQPSF